MSASKKTSSSMEEPSQEIEEVDPAADNEYIDKVLQDAASND